MFERSKFNADFLHFLCHGVLTISIFVIVNSVAKDIEPNSVGLVYLANSAPELVIKIFGSYFFHLFSYRLRYILCSILFICALIIISLSISNSYKFNHALIGISLNAAAGGLGESSTLALAAYLDDEYLISAFSTGSGLAGIFGYLWTIVFKDFFGLNSSIIIAFALFIPVFLYLNFVYFIEPKILEKKVKTLEINESLLLLSNEDDKKIKRRKKSSLQEKLKIIFILKSYMFILFFVYFAEYALQSGVWASLGSPVNIKESRDESYLFANFLYQIGVLFSKSSANFFQINFKFLSILPFLQFILLILFYLNGIYWFIESMVVQYFFCFVSGLFGGIVYVNTFSLISKNNEIPTYFQEFSISSANIADTSGTIVGNLFGLLIQGCLYGSNHIRDFDSKPIFSCGYNFSLHL